MLLVILIDVAAIGGLLALAYYPGLERALPFAAFLLVLVPIESALPMGVFSLTTHRIIVTILTVCYCTRAPKVPGRRHTPLIRLMTVHVLWCLVSVGNSIVPMMSVKKLLSVALEYYVLYYVYYHTVSSVETIRKILTAILIAIVLCSVWGVGEAYAGWDLFPYFPTVSHHWGGGDVDRDVRIRSTYPHSILYGAALAMGITLALYCRNFMRKPVQTLWLCVGLMLLFLNIYKTSSRGPWLDVIVGCLLLLAFGTGRVRRALSYIAVLSLAVLVIRPGVWGTIKGLVENTLNEDTATGTSYSYRYELPRVAVARLLQEPTRALWGFGPESFYDVHLKGTLAGKPFDFLSCDNAWVEMLVETGFVGLGIMLCLLLTPAWLVWRGFRKKAGVDRQLSLVLFVNLVMFYLQMYSVGMYSWGQNGYALWILIAIALVHLRMTRPTVARSVVARTGQVTDSFVFQNACCSASLV